MRQLLGSLLHVLQVLSTSQTLATQNGIFQMQTIERITRHGVADCQLARQAFGLLHRFFFRCTRGHMFPLRRLTPCRLR
ncbi:MAG: hypothetical protein IJU36_08025 [Paludibacteraceae bacterium]|nr:hypothetical protein [Paludibacteraceae bacterium]